MKLKVVPPISMKMLGTGVAIILALVVPFAIQGSPFYLDLIIRTALYAFLGMAWNISAGYTGLIAFNHIALFGIGAYTSTLLQALYGVNPWIGMLLGALLSALVAVGFTYPSVKLKGLFLALATIAFASALQILFLNWRIVIYGPEGLPKYIGGAVGIFIPLKSESLIDFQWHTTKLPYCYAILSFLGLQLFSVSKLMKSRTGYYLIAIREDEAATAHLGINVTKYKLIAMAIAALFSAIAGSFSAQYLLFVEPLSTMSLTFMFEIALLAIMGGMGTLMGPLLGSVVYVPISTLLRVLLGGTLYSGLSLIIFGFVLIIITIMMPAGLLKETKKLYNEWIARRQT